MRVKHNVLVQVARDTAMKNKLFAPDSSLNEVVIDDFQKHTSGDIDLEEDQSLTVSFGDVTTVRGLYLEVDQDVLVKLNGDDTGIRLRLAPEAAIAKLFLEATITAIVIENDAGEAATGIYLLWGDPVA